MKKFINVTVYILLLVMIGMNIALVLERPQAGKLAEIEMLIEDKFIEEPELEPLRDAAAQAMVKATGDRWSYYISAEDYESHMEQMENAYVGVGITILIQEEGILIQQVTPGGPAEEAGLLADDVILTIEGQSTLGMDAEAARNLVRGKEGTCVSMTVLRQGQELDFDVERRTIETVVAQGQMLRDNIGYVQIFNFDTRCYDETVAAIESLLDQGAEKLIFDVRFNPGGYARELVKVLDYLLPEGELFRTVDYAGREDVDMSDADYLDVPMAVLVNGDSYSAAEFFAAALSEYDAAVVVGEKTVGKGYFQTTYRLSDGSALNISIGKYFTPKGVSLAGVGITPDVELPVDEDTYWDIYAGKVPVEEDIQIQAAVEALSK